MAVLISGSGTTLLNLLERRAAGRFAPEIALVVSSNPEAGGLAHAQAFGVPSCVEQRRSYASTEAFSQAIFARCRAANIDLVVMGGFLKHILIPDDFADRVINIHPSLIPAFCGQGFYGHHVHEAVLSYGAKVSGCTIHFVDNQYDHGPIIWQEAVRVHDDDTPQSLAARVFVAECEAYPRAIEWITQGQVHRTGRRVSVGELNPYRDD